MDCKQKIKRQTKVQFYYQQTEERRNRIHFAIKTNRFFYSPLKSYRFMEKMKLDSFSPSKAGNTSCCCEECGKASAFKQRQFQLNPFDGTAQHKNQMLRENSILDRYRNSKFIRVFRRLVYCLQFIIRYKIVQNIRNRQRTRMKKVMKTRLEQSHRMTFLNVLDIATKQFHSSPKFKSASNFDFIISQNATALNSPQDSDEEFYHFKPRKSLIPKSTHEDEHHQKLSKQQQRVYLLTTTNTVLNKYISQKLATKKDLKKSNLPPLLSLTVSPRPQQQTPYQIKIRHHK